ncbi:type II secretion system minor pseudopilin GspK [bacterium]|nr:type II secretion system minor pseudopilin GspK [bacterium]
MRPARLATVPGTGNATGSSRPRAVERERGLALLSALLAVTLLTVVVVELADAVMVHVHLGRNAGNAVAAQLLARSAVVAGEALLIEDAKQNPSVTSPDGLWAMPIVVPAGDGTVGLQISDEDGKLDLNQVRDKRMRAALERLFTELDLDPGLLDEIVAWTEPPGSPAGEGAASFCALPDCVPRRAPLGSVEELRLLRGFDDRALQKLRPYVTAWGERSSTVGVNVNTADPVVLRAIGCEVGADFRVPPGGFEQTRDVEACPEGDARSLVRIKSGVFKIVASGTVGDLTQGVTAIVRRDARRATRLSWRERPVSDLAPPGVT